jgi:dextranase
LLHGEDHSVLTEAYYARHGELEPETHDATRRYYDFAVRYGDLLFDRSAVDLTRTHLGGVNEEVKIDAWVPVSLESAPGTLWARVTRISSGLLVSLVNLAGQTDDLWDAPKRATEPSGAVQLTLERRGADAPRFLFAEPDGAVALAELESSYDGRYDTVSLPQFGAWSIVWIPS